MSTFSTLDKVLGSADFRYNRGVQPTPIEPTDDRETIRASGHTQGEASQAPHMPSEAPRKALVLASEPGPKGCQAIASHGGTCAAPALLGTNLCRGHTLGAEACVQMHEARPKAIRARASTRALLLLEHNGRRSWTPRGALKAAAALKATEIAERIVGGVLDPATDPVAAAKLGLALVQQVDPAPAASLSVTADLDSIGTADLLRLADSFADSA